MSGLADIFDIAQACGRWKRYARGALIQCPCHNDPNPSCALWYGDGQIFCKCFSGCDWRDVQDSLRGRGFVMSLRESNGYAKRDLSQVTYARRPTPDHDNHVRTMLARDIWDEGYEALSSPIASYLMDRGLCLETVPEIDRTIRFHPRCPRGKERQSAMVCSLRDFATDHVIGIHRTYLRDGAKDGSMMLGPSHETAVKVSPHTSMFARGRTFAPLLHVCEGVETAIGCLMLGFSPVWALGSAGAIERFEPQLAIGELIVLADHDRTITDCHGRQWQPGEKAARACVKNWRMAGWRAGYVMPQVEGEDFADVARRRI